MAKIALEVPVFEFISTRRERAKNRFISRGRTMIQQDHFPHLVKRGKRYVMNQCRPVEPEDWRRIPYHLRVAVVAYLSTEKPDAGSTRRRRDRNLRDLLPV